MNMFVFIFFHVGWLQTYNTDYQVPDSAGTATAILSGIKTKSGIIGLDDSAMRYDCDSSKGAEIDSVFDMAVGQGRQPIHIILSSLEDIFSIFQFPYPRLEPTLIILQHCLAAESAHIQDGPHS